jgi:hypothetical protein
MLQKFEQFHTLCCAGIATLYPQKAVFKLQP